MTTPVTRAIASTFAYHPADDTPDLHLPTEVVARYHVADTTHRPAIDPGLEWDIKTHGILHPLKLYTNGVFALIGDGNHRCRIAMKLGIEKLPLQILPDNFRRMQSRKGYPPLEPELKAWIDENLWSHDGHEVIRHNIGGGSGAGILANSFIKCTCSCGSRWKQEA